MNIGYVRASTLEQDEQKQVFEIERYILSNKMILDNVISINISSRKKLEKRKINELFEMLKENDNLIVTEMSRLARSNKELELMFEQLKQMKVNIILIKEGMTIRYDESNAMTTLFRQMLQSFAEFERNMISMRTKEALQSKRDKAKSLGIELKLGHNLKFMANKFDKYEDNIVLLLNKNNSFTTVTAILNNTVAVNEEKSLKSPALTKWVHSRLEQDKISKVWLRKSEWNKFKQ